MASRLSAAARWSRSSGALVIAAIAIVAAAATPTYGTTSASVTAARPRATAASQLTYHGGPVLHSTGVYAIFWVPPAYSLPNGYQSTVTQYYDVTNGAKKFVSYSVVSRGSNVDTRAFPKSGCPNYVLDSKSGAKSKVCLTDAQIQKEVKSVIAAHNLPTGISNEYFVFTPPRVANCKAAKPSQSRGCFDPIQQDGYCAYHSHLTTNGHAVLYDVLPYEDPTGVCWSGQSPNGNPADSVVNTASHEQNESITDPLGTGWYDSAGAEIGDKCHLTFGSAISSTSTGMYNEVINGHGYWLQEVWSNRAKACVQRNTFPQPTASFAFSPKSPVHGKKVTFASSVSEPGVKSFSYRWGFPDGGVATAKNPSHNFAKPVFVGIVTLIVTDPHGNQTRVTKSITVT